MKHKCWVILVAVCCAFCVSLPGLARGQPSLLLDGNLTAGYQGLDGLVGVQPGQRVALEVYGKGIEGISGFSAQIAYDAAQLSFESFSAGDIIPHFTGLNTAASSGAIEIGGASVSGASRVSQGRLGVVYFQALSGFSGDASVSISSGKVSAGATSTSVSGQAQVTVGLAVSGPVVLDADAAPGLQALRNVVDANVGDVIAIELYGKDIAGASGYSATVEYPAAQLAFVDFSATELIPDMTGLATESGGSVEIGGASVSGAALASEGRLGVVRFVVQSGFTGSATIRLTGGRLSIGTATSDYTSTMAVSVTGEAAVKSPDFDGSGKVDFQDFLTFAAGFGKSQGEPGFDSRLDFDGSGKVDFQDFLTFAGAFGK